MNTNNIENLINDDSLKNIIKKIIEYEQSQLHRSRPIYKQKYHDLIEEDINEVNKN